MIYRTKLTGVKPPNRQKCIHAYLSQGTRLAAYHEPSPQDPNNVSIYIITPDVTTQIGSLNARYSALVAPAIDAGKPITVIVTEITGGTPDKPTTGVNVAVAIDEDVQVRYINTSGQQINQDGTPIDRPHISKTAVIILVLLLTIIILTIIGINSQ